MSILPHCEVAEGRLGKKQGEEGRGGHWLFEASNSPYSPGDTFFTQLSDIRHGGDQATRLWEDDVEPTWSRSVSSASASACTPAALWRSHRPAHRRRAWVCAGSACLCWAHGQRRICREGKGRQGVGFVNFPRRVAFYHDGPAIDWVVWTDLLKGATHTHTH